MPAFNFQKQWADAVELGARLASAALVGTPLSHVPPKRTTIRKAGRAAPGQRLVFYTGQRTKACRKLGEALCLAVTPITLERTKPLYGDPIGLVLGGQVIRGDELERLARLDTAGLWGADDLLRFLDETYPPRQELALYCW